MFKKLINFAALCIFFNTLGAQTCDVDLIGYDPVTHEISVAILNSENCGCNEYTQQDGNTCGPDNSSSTVMNNESITHFVFGLHIYEDYTAGPCSQANYHPGWTFAYPPDQTMLPFTGGHVTGDTVNVQLNTFFDWECLLDADLEEGQCWQLVVWQINLSQSTDIEDFPNDFWTDTCGVCANQTQMYPDIDLSNNSIVWCPDELPPPPLYPGCMDSEAENYDPAAGYDDGTCTYPPILGCTNPIACNYNQFATENDGSCVTCENTYEEGVAGCGQSTWEWYIDLFDCEEEELIVDIELDSLWVYAANCNIFNQPQGACVPGIRYHTIASNVGQDSIYSYLFEWTGPNGFSSSAEYGVNFNGGDNFYAVPLPPGVTGNTINSFTQDMEWEEGDELCVVVSVLGQDETVLSNNSICITLPAMPICIWGCMDPAATNYNPDATCDNGNCQLPILGCTDPEAINYTPDATEDDGSCEYLITELTYVSAECLVDCGQDGPFWYVITTWTNTGDVEITDFCAEWDVLGGMGDIQECWEGSLMPGETVELQFGPYTQNGSPVAWAYLQILNGEQIIPQIENYETLYCYEEAEALCVYGCTDPAANNYDPDADLEDGSCTYDILGCTDPEANNFDPTANVDDGSCTYDIYGCTDPMANNYNPLATIDDGMCTYDVLGCTDSSALNYDPLANVDDGSCQYDVFGCTDPSAANYNPLATVDDGSCYFVGPDCTGEDGLIFAPNTFTPNNDGVNDGWRVEVANPDCWRSWYVAIFNRWGGLVWESYTPGETWPGSVFDGNHYVADGVYVYLVQGEGWDPAITFKKTGHITIFR